MLLHKRTYTEALIEEFKEVTPASKWTTTGEPEHFSKLSPSPPDVTNSDHIGWVNRAQKILGVLLWLSTRTTEISPVQSLAAQCLWRNLEDLKVRIKHLLQYLSTTRTFGLLYLYPQNSTQASSLATIPEHHSNFWSPLSIPSKLDSSIITDWIRCLLRRFFFAPAGKVRSQDTAWCSLMELSATWFTGVALEKRRSPSRQQSRNCMHSPLRHCLGRNFRFLAQEFLTTDPLLNLRCDNKAIAMLEKLSWRTRYMSIYGESLRGEMDDRTCLLTYLSTELQLADPLINPLHLR